MRISVFSKNPIFEPIVMKWSIFSTTSFFKNTCLSNAPTVNDSCMKEMLFLSRLKMKSSWVLN